MNPRWQRARILPCEGDDIIQCARAGEECLHGHCVWVQIEPSADGYVATNLNWDMKAQYLERIADFAENVEILSREQFLAECRASRAEEGRR